MKVRIILLVVLFFTIHNHAISQTSYFNKLIQTSGSEDPAAILYCDSFYLVYGHKIVYPTLDQEVFLYKIDLTGQLMAEKRINSGMVNISRSDNKGIIKVNDSLFAFVTSVRDTQIIGGSNRIYGKLFFIDKDFESLNSLSFYDTTSVDPKSYMTFEDIVQTPDKGYAITGTYLTTDPHYNTALFRLDSTGGFLWRKHYGNWHRTRPYTLHIMPDSGYVISGLYWKSNHEGNGWAIRLDKVGNVIWQNSYGDGLDDWIYCSALNHSKTDLIIGLTSEKQTFPIDLINAKIIKTQLSSGSITNSTTVDDFYMNIPKSIITHPNGDITFISDILFIDSLNMIGGRISAIYKVNNQHDSIFMRLLNKVSPYSTKGEHYVIDMIQTPDKGYAIAGWYRALEPTIQATQTWIMKLDSLGCDTPGCQYASIPDHSIIVRPLSLYPNPATDFVNVDFEVSDFTYEYRMEVYDLKGQKKLTQDLNGYDRVHTIPVSSLGSGVYMIVVRSNGRIVAGGKFVKER